MTTKNVSPLRYPGGKTRACKILDQIVIDNFDIDSINTVIVKYRNKRTNGTIETCRP